MDNQPAPAKPATPAPEKKAYGSGYGKRPLWQWIALYVVIGGAAYAAIYYFYFAKRGYTYTEPAPATVPAGRPTGAMPVLNGQPTPPPPAGQPQNW